MSGGAAAGLEDGALDGRGSLGVAVLVDRCVVLAAGNGFRGGQVLVLALGFAIVGLELADQAPESDGLGEVAALLVEAGQAAIEVQVLGASFAGLFQQPDRGVEQAQRVGGLGHGHLRGNVPRIALQHRFAQLEHLEVIGGGAGLLDLGHASQVGQPGQPVAAFVVAVLGFFGSAQGLPVDEVRGIEPAAGDQQFDPVIEAPRGHHLLGTLELADGHTALVRRRFRQQRGATAIRAHEEDPQGELLPPTATPGETPCLESADPGSLWSG